MKSGIVLLVCVVLLCTLLLSACAGTQTLTKNPVSSSAQISSIGQTSGVVVESQMASTDSTSSVISETQVSSMDITSSVTSESQASSKATSSAATSSKDSTLTNASPNIVILSQNVRCGDDGNGNDIADRAPRLKKLIDKYKPDIIGTQESTGAWNKYYNENFKGTYAAFGKNRDGDTAAGGEWGTILYRKDRFELVKGGNFWLSDTPKKVSKLSGSQCNRICTWVLLKDKVTGKTFVMANTHLDLASDTIRTKQLDILFNELSDLMSQYPMFLTGDFNTTPNSSTYEAAVSKLADPYKSAKENKSTVDYTYHAYGTLAPGSLIDFCFYNKNKVDALWCKIVNDDFGGYVSDHYGVVCEFLLK